MGPRRAADPLAVPPSGDPGPSPPANVSQLRVEGQPGEAPKTFRKQMARHTAEPACAACHRKMDPLGHALEAFDAAGTWRAQDRGQPVDDAGELPNGREIKGVTGLKRVLIKRKADFVRNLVEQMFLLRPRPRAGARGRPGRRAGRAPAGGRGVQVLDAHPPGRRQRPVLDAAGVQ